MLKQLPNIHAVSTRVVRVLGQNPGPFTLQGTNTYLIGTGASRILLDTGEGRAQYLPILQQAMRDAGCTRIERVVITHNHVDHVGGLHDVANMWPGDVLPVSKIAPDALSLSDPTHHHRLRVTGLADNDVLRTEGATLRVIQTPGHTADHMCILLEEENAVFSGDCVLGGGSCVFENLAAYMRSLHKLKALQAATIYPGHGAVVADPAAKLDEYILHRNTREAQVVACLTAAANHRLDSWAIVEQMYPEVQQPILRQAANSNVRLHLGKLIEEGRARKHDDDDTFSLVL